jgi:proteasome lid subunit RPN8/RPN11
VDILKPVSPSEILLQRSHWQEMLADVTQRELEEACGLVAGKGVTSLAVIPMANVLHSPVRYRLDPQEQFEVFRRIAASGWELLAIYHSHLDGPPWPSPTDIAEATYPEAVYLIWSKIRESWDCRGFLISAGRFQAVRVEVIDSFK